MSYKCEKGLHSWVGCICSKCSQTRDEQHNWSTDCEKCTVCGKTTKNQHDWSKDCEKCSKCGKTIENGHDWSHDCEKCSKCGKALVNKHLWKGFKCKVCEKYNPKLATDLIIKLATKGSIQKIKEAIIAGANINAQDQDGKTPLFLAVEKGDEEIVELLVSAGADVNKKNKSGNSPLHNALENNDIKISKMLISAGVNINEPFSEYGTYAICHVAAYGLKEVAELLISLGCDVNANNKHCETPLWYAVESRHIELVKLLIASGANINAKSFTYSGRSPLHLICNKTFRESYIDDLRYRYHESETANELARLEVEIKEYESKNSGLIVIEKNNQILIAELLIANGADLNAKDNRGLTPLELAKNNYQHDLLKVFEKFKPSTL